MKQNQSDILYLLEEGGTLNQFGIKVIGIISDASQLPDPATYEGEYGDAYAVGDEAPYTFYIFTRKVSGTTAPQWFNIGIFPAPSTVPGPQGPQGGQGEQGVRGSKWFVGSGAPQGGAQYNANDMYLDLTIGNVYIYDTNGNWAMQGSIRGPQGIQGLQGLQGERGIQGPIGPIGPVGPQGESISIIGTLASSTSLPDPDAEYANKAFLVNHNPGAAPNPPYDIWICILSKDTGEYEWVMSGSFTGKQGPQGPQGETGAPGPQGIPGISYPIYYCNDTFTYNVGVPGSSNSYPKIYPASPIPRVDSLVIFTVDGVLGRIRGGGPEAFTVDLLAVLQGPAGISPSAIMLTPSSATSGTLTQDQFNILTSNDFNYIILNNEVYWMADKTHEAGYFVYSHVGMTSLKDTFIKTITITISTLGWVLSSLEVSPKLYHHELLFRFPSSLAGYSFDIYCNLITSDKDPYSFSELRTRLNKYNPAGTVSLNYSVIPPSTGGLGAIVESFFFRGTFCLALSTLDPAQNYRVLRHDVLSLQDSRYSLISDTVKPV